MEYQLIEKSWNKAFDDGNIDEALKLIQYQIAMNLVKVHNEFSDLKLESPGEAIAYLSYAKVRAEDEEKMIPFILLDFRFIELGHSFDEGMPYTKEQVLEEYKQLEDSLIEEISLI